MGCSVGRCCVPCRCHSKSPIQTGFAGTEQAAGQAGSAIPWTKDTLLHIVVHWDVYHPLDFISGVVDFATLTRAHDNVAYYGFARETSDSTGNHGSLTKATCWEGYDCADGFISHLKTMAESDPEVKPMEEMLHNGIADISCIEAYGPKEQLELLARHIDPMKKPTSFYAHVDAGSWYREQHYMGAKSFERDTTVSAIYLWRAADVNAFAGQWIQNFWDQKPLKSSEGLKRWSVSCDVTTLSGQGMVATFLCYTAMQACIAHWQSTIKPFEACVGSAEIVQLTLHGPGDAMRIAQHDSTWSFLEKRSGNAKVFLHSLHGSYYCPIMVQVAESEFKEASSIKSSRKLTMSEEDIDVFDGKVNLVDPNAPITPEAIRGVRSERCLMSSEDLELVASKAEAQYGRSAYLKMCMRDINKTIILPECERKNGQPYADLQSVEKEFVFVTHAWQENFDEFVQCVTTEVKKLEAKHGHKIYIWICAFALVQSKNPVDIQKQLKSDPAKAPFTKALDQAGWFLIVRNKTVDIYTRMWCCWELYCALKRGLLKTGRLVITGSNELSKPSMCLNSDISNAEAFDPNDKEMILSHINRTEGAYDHINLLINLLRQV